MNAGKLAIMQPYFFPYVGYWQLISHVDTFVLFDDVQYIRHGWINRNRILKPEADWQYIIVPLEKHPRSSKICDVKAVEGQAWKDRIMGQLMPYRKIAPYYRLTAQLVMDALFTGNSRKVTEINLNIVRVISNAIGLTTKFVVSSEQNFDYSNVNDPGEWALRISEQMNASEYLNPISGAALFDETKFVDAGIRLGFVQSHGITYDQRRPFIPWLSIVDILMFNSIEETKNFLSRYQVVNTL